MAIYHLGLVGYPLDHSLSPSLHAVALKVCGLEGDYSLFPIHPDNKQGLQALLKRVRTGEIQGLNVTIPHKQTVIELVDELTPTAHAIGAVNTIYLKENKLIGHNTDAQGFLFDLKKFLDNHQSSIENRRATIVLGAGGSARAVVYALVGNEWNVIVAARRIEQAHEMAKRFAGIRVMELDFQTFRPSNLQLIVNTTPLGMFPNIDQTPWPENLPFPDAAIYDLVYNPRETKLVKDARAHGLQATTGLGMLIEQAALAFELWTGCDVPREVLFQSVGQ